jgi:phosphatidylinositol kinase/protein kinase (PI-3  family)
MHTGNASATITPMDSEILTTEHEKSLLKAAIEDPSAAVFKETFEAKEERVKGESPFGNSPRWKLYSVIVKAGSDLRQEHLALQLMHEMERVWKQNDCPIYLYCYRILVSSDEAGLIETIPDSISIHSIKKSGYAKRVGQKGVTYSLYDYFIETHGDPGSESFLQAQDNFLHSLVGYCIISYILQVKDRHNGNILMKASGHLVHIDFGFVLSNSPGLHLI